MENTNKTQIVAEPEVLYQTTTEFEQRKTDLLDRLLDLAIKQSEAGLGIPHEEVMRKIKLKYNLKF